MPHETSTRPGQPHLALTALDTSSIPTGTQVMVIERTGRSDRDPAEAVLDEIKAHDVSRLVIGLKRRSPVGKALLGSVSQRLLLESPVTVVAVKLREGQGDA
jgi:nucleotide-binding universal stress UspA family protein